MSNDFDKYLAIANHDIQMANNTAELKSYVASILYDNDKKVELLQQKENIIKEVREYINNMKPLNEEETDIKEMLKEAYSEDNIKGLEINFKTICHLEDFEIAIWNIKDILDKGE